MIFLPRPKCIFLLSVLLGLVYQTDGAQIGKEVAVPNHLQDGQEFELPLSSLLSFGEKLFSANWTRQEGGGRPLMKGNGKPLSDSSNPLVFPRNFNRISGPDANSCAGCHNAPVIGGNGDIVANVFASAQRFDFVTFSSKNNAPTVSGTDERGENVSLQGIANSRATVGMFGAGFIEMVARQMTAELQEIRNSIQPGETKELTAKGILFGRLTKRPDGTWDTSSVEGIANSSLSLSGTNPPSLIIRPFSHSAISSSIRGFSNNAFNQHHGIQTTERFGKDTDPDGDGFVNEMTRADLTAVALFQAAMAVPGRVIPNNPEIEAAVLVGEERFTAIGCARCHVPCLPLVNGGWVFSEPSPYNSQGTLRAGDVPSLTMDLTSDALPQPRLKRVGDVVHVPAFTDLKLHDITSGPDDPNKEPLDGGQTAGTEAFFSGNNKFLTKKLWGVASKPNYFHHGHYTTMREAILAHAGEASSECKGFESLSEYEQGCVIEFLKTLQVLPNGTKATIVDELGRPKIWPPTRFVSITRNGADLTLQWQGSANVYEVQRVFQVQKKYAIDSDVWDNVEGPTTGNSLTIKANGDAVLYRIKLLSP